MNIDPELARKLAELKKQLEAVTGKEIDASPEQLAAFAYPAGSAFYEENSQVLWRRIIFPGKFCVSPVTLLDASGRSSTGTNGTIVFLLSSFICSDINSFSEPVFLLATPHVASACYITMTHQIVPDQNHPGYNDVQITAHAWGPNGTPAPNISFDWRCRVVSNPIIFANRRKLGPSDGILSYLGRS
jgi:hypothetical protein